MVWCSLFVCLIYESIFFIIEHNKIPWWLILQKLILLKKKTNVLLLSVLVRIAEKLKTVICLFFPSIAKYSIPKHLVIVNAAPDANKELNPTVTPIIINPLQFQSSLHRGKDDTDANCWTSPSGMGFMIRGKTYLKDNSKVSLSYLYFFGSIVIRLSSRILFLVLHVMI